MNPEWIPKEVSWVIAHLEALQTVPTVAKQYGNIIRRKREVFELVLETTKVRLVDLWHVDGFVEDLHL